MKLQDDLIKILSKTYEPTAMTDMKFRGKELSFRTDEKGQPILLFIGERKEDGTIRGERYARRLAYEQDGKVIKDHWELKGKAS